MHDPGDEHQESIRPSKEEPERNEQEVVEGEDWDDTRALAEGAD